MNLLTNPEFNPELAELMATLQLKKGEKTLTLPKNIPGNHFLTGGMGQGVNGNFGFHDGNSTFNGVHGNKAITKLVETFQQEKKFQAMTRQSVYKGGIFLPDGGLILVNTTKTTLFLTVTNNSLFMTDNEPNFQLVLETIDTEGYVLDGGRVIKINDFAEDFQILFQK